ncbi:MAG: hypothetical protein GEV28_17485 [Actinophytocola sp.]|uniref:hypothetical protein n=1 Tax=Actinophytocola sp. TaxID=1872138 RepID=UPI001327596E|nr:hypothetical protein [Actinophytocola sp.]MPZ82082.1 hypothetical protein [Actinophytocola sp.]
MCTGRVGRCEYQGFDVLRYFSRAEMERIARNIEEAAVQAAVEPEAPTRITRPVTAGVVQ